LEPEHPDTAQSLNNLAVLYYEQGKYNKLNHCCNAPLLSVSTSSDLTTLKPRKSLNSLAVLYCKQGKYEQADSLLQGALAICEQHLEPDTRHGSKSQTASHALLRAG